MNFLTFKLGPDNSIKWTNADINTAIENHDIDKQINGETMLMHSVKIGDYKLAKRLLELGADPSLGDYEDRTPLWLCTIYNQYQIAKLLIENGASFEEEEGHNSPLYNAIKYDNNEVAETLIELGANPNLKNRDEQTPLHCATFKKNYRIVELLLRHGANKNVKNNIKPLPGELLLEPVQKQTPYEMAISSGDQRLISLFEKDYKKNDSSKKESNSNTNKTFELSERDLNRFAKYLCDEEAFSKEAKKNVFLNVEYDNITKKIELFDEDNKIKTSLFSRYNEGYEQYAEYIMKKLVPNYFIEEEKIKSQIAEIEQKLNELEKPKEIIEHIDNLSKQRLTYIEKPPTLGQLIEEHWIFFLFSLCVIAITIVCEQRNEGYQGIIMDFGYTIIFGIPGVFSQNNIDNVSASLVVLKILIDILYGVIYFAIGYSPYVTICFICFLPIATLLYFYKDIKKRRKQRKESIKKNKEIEKQIEKYNQKLEIHKQTMKTDITKLSNILSKKYDELNKLQCDSTLDTNEVKNCCKTKNEQVNRQIIKLKKETIRRWNDFANFRKKHYIREYEEEISESMIIDKISKLVDRDPKLDKTKINSKNYIDTGTPEDYAKYIFNIIDSEDEEL